MNDSAILKKLSSEEKKQRHIQKPSKMELFAKIANDWESLAIFAKSSILDLWQGSEYAFVK